MPARCCEEIYDKNSFAPIGLSGHRIVCDASDNGLFVVGGWNPEYISPDPDDVDNHYVRQVWKYNFTTKIWTQLRSENPPVSLASHTLTKLDDKRLLFYGGSLSARNVLGNNNETYLYNIKDEQWQKLETTGNRCRVECGHWFGQAMCKVEDNIIVSTGFRRESLKIHKLNLRNLEWEDLSSNAQRNTREQNRSTRLLANNNNNRVEWGEEPNCRVRHEMVPYDNKVFVIGGGKHFHRGAYALDKFPCFDLRCNKWSEVRTTPDNAHGFPKSRTCATAVVYGDFVYITGGYCDNETDENDPDESRVQVWNDIWRLHLPTLKWTQLSVKLAEPLWFHAADVTSEGVMYIYGGCSDSNYEEHRKNTLYKITLDAEPQRLETMSWNAFQAHSQAPVASISDNKFSEMGVHKKFISKVRW